MVVGVVVEAEGNVVVTVVEGVEVIVGVVVVVVVEVVVVVVVVVVDVVVAEIYKTEGAPLSMIVIN